MKNGLCWLAIVVLGVVLLAGCTQAESTPTAVAPTGSPTLEPTSTPDPIGSDQKELNQVIKAAFAPFSCPDVPIAQYSISDYTGPIIDSHFHIPHLPDSFNGVRPVLGENVTMSEIVCTLKHEGTSKVFAFFPVFPEVDPKDPLEVAYQTMLRYPATFVPFIMPPGPDDVPPTADAGTLSELLAVHPGLFRGYGEIGLYELEGRREADDYPPDAAIFLDIYPVVRDHNLIVYFHPGEGHEDNLERVLQQYPEITFIVHGEQIEDDIANLVENYPNIYFTVNDLYGDQYLLHPGENKDTFLAALKVYEPLLRQDIGKWKDLIEAYPNRFMWGTDRGDAVWAFDREVGKTLVDYGRAFIGRLDTKVQPMFAYKNAERLLSGGE